MLVIAGEYLQELQQWLHMFDTSLIQVFTSPCFTVMFKKIISLIINEMVKILAALSISNSSGDIKRVAAIVTALSANHFQGYSGWSYPHNSG